MQQPIDRKQRHAALNTQRSICVTAPAGSGKTELLTQRMLALLAKVEQPEQVLAITFTRKAATEMQLRIIDALREAQQSPEPPAQSYQHQRWVLAKTALANNETRQWNLLENPNRLRIQTIDSFCNYLTRQLPILSAFGAPPAISHHPQHYYQKAVRQLIHSIDTSPAADDLARLLAHLDNNVDTTERLLVTLLEQREQWLIHIGTGHYQDHVKTLLEQTAQQIIEDTLTQLRQQLSPYADKCTPLFNYAARNLHRDGSPSIIAVLSGINTLPDTHHNAVSQWLAIADLLLTAQNHWRKSIDKRQGFPIITEDGNRQLAKTNKARFKMLLEQLQPNHQLLHALIDLRHLPPAQFVQQQWDIMAALSRLLPLLVAQLHMLFQQHGQVDYSHMTMAALGALNTEDTTTEVMLTLDYQIHHLLIDEFQDTSSTQFELIKRLVTCWPEHNTNHPKHPRTLFIVGDGMQSIYGFRAANVSLFIQARQQGISHLALDDVTLSTNFRSQMPIIEWVNQHFSKAFPNRANMSRGAVSYTPSSTHQTDDFNSTVSVSGFTDRSEEAAHVVRLVEQAQHKQPSGSIAILVRHRHHLQPIISLLKAANISWQAMDIDPLLNDSLVADLYSLAKCLLSTHDRIAWAALLRSPLCGLDNQDLCHLLSQTYTSVWAAMQDCDRRNALSEHGQTRLAAICPIIQYTLQQRQRRNFRQQLEALWLHLGGAGLLQNEADYQAVDSFLDAVENDQRGGQLSIDDFERHIHKRYMRQPYIANTEACSLHIMTMHKAKGLEFDTVIIPSLAKPAKADSRSLLMWRDYVSCGGKNGLLMSPIPAIGNNDDALYQHLRYEQSQTAQLENTRLLYVATTRAICSLHLSFTLASMEQTPPHNSLIHTLWPTIQHEVQWVMTDRNHSPTTHHTTDETLQRIHKDWQPPTYQATNPLEHYRTSGCTNAANNHSITNDLTSLHSLTESLSNCVGKIVHQLLEQLVHHGPAYWQAKNQALRTQWLHSLFRYHQLSANNWPQAQQQVEQAINNTLNDERGRWLLAATHPESYTELALMSSTSTRVQTRVIDRTFIDENGDRWIIDYKTASPQNHETRDGFIARQIDHYQPQLANYQDYLSRYMASASTQHSSATIKTALYFTHFPHWQVIECPLI